MQRIRFLIYTIIGFSLFSCHSNQAPQSHPHDHDIIGGHDHHDEHQHSDGTESITLFSDYYELFVEFPSLVAGQTSTFESHLTKLYRHDPLLQGLLTVSLIKDNRGIRNTVEAPDSPGIFKASLQPLEPGVYRLLFELTSERGLTTFEIPAITVYSNSHDATHIKETDTGIDLITFPKEQAWNTDFETQQIIPSPFYSIIRTSARVKSAPQSEIIINSQADGVVSLLTVLGQTVRKGDLLARISGLGLQSNINFILNESRINFEKSKADYLRSKPLAENQAISQRDFLEILSRYRQDSLRYAQLSNMVHNSGLNITSPINGFITNIAVPNGGFVQSGSPVITVSNDSKIMIQAFVNKPDWQKVISVFDANFKVSGIQNAISLEEINGTVVANNTFLNDYTTRIPVTFAGNNNGTMVPGMLVEAFLKTGKKDNAMVVPLTSIVEQQGLYYVFVQTGGESFIKRQVELAHNDGIQTEVISGLAPGERIVTKGAIQVKLASMAGNLPLHGHTH